MFEGVLTEKSIANRDRKVNDELIPVFRSILADKVWGTFKREDIGEIYVIISRLYTALVMEVKGDYYIEYFVPNPKKYLPGEISQEGFTIYKVIPEAKEYFLDYIYSLKNSESEYWVTNISGFKKDYLAAISEDSFKAETGNLYDYLMLSRWPFRFITLNYYDNVIKHYALEKGAKVAISDNKQGIYTWEDTEYAAYFGKEIIQVPPTYFVEVNIRDREKNVIGKMDYYVDGKIVKMHLPKGMPKIESTPIEDDIVGFFVAYPNFEFKQPPTVESLNFRTLTIGAFKPRLSVVFESLGIKAPKEKGEKIEISGELIDKIKDFVEKAKTGDWQESRKIIFATLGVYYLLMKYADDDNPHAISAINLAGIEEIIDSSALVDSNGINTIIPIMVSYNLLENLLVAVKDGLENRIAEKGASDITNEFYEDISREIDENLYSFSLAIFEAIVRGAKLWSGEKPITEEELKKNDEFQKLYAYLFARDFATVKDSISSLLREKIVKAKQDDELKEIYEEVFDAVVRFYGTLVSTLAGRDVVYKPLILEWTKTVGNKEKKLNIKATEAVLKDEKNGIIYEPINLNVAVVKSALVDLFTNAFSKDFRKSKEAFEKALAFAPFGNIEESKIANSIYTHLAKPYGLDALRYYKSIRFVTTSMPIKLREAISHRNIAKVISALAEDLGINYNAYLKNLAFGKNIKKLFRSKYQVEKYLFSRVLFSAVKKGLGRLVEKLTAGLTDLDKKIVRELVKDIEIDEKAEELGKYVKDAVDVDKQEDKLNELEQKASQFFENYTEEYVTPQVEQAFKAQVEWGYRTSRITAITRVLDFYRSNLDGIVQTILEYFVRFTALHLAILEATADYIYNTKLIAVESEEEKAQYEKEYLETKAKKGEADYGSQLLGYIKKYVNLLDTNDYIKIINDIAEKLEDDPYLFELFMSIVYNVYFSIISRIISFDRKFANAYKAFLTKILNRERVSSKDLYFLRDVVAYFEDVIKEKLFMVLVNPEVLYATLDLPERSFLSSAEGAFTKDWLIFLRKLSNAISDYISELELVVNRIVERGFLEVVEDIKAYHHPIANIINTASQFGLKEYKILKNDKTNSIAKSKVLYAIANILGHTVDVEESGKEDTGNFKLPKALSEFFKSVEEIDKTQGVVAVEDKPYLIHFAEKEYSNKEKEKEGENKLVLTKGVSITSPLYFRAASNAISTFMTSLSLLDGIALKVLEKAKGEYKEELQEVLKKFRAYAPVSLFTPNEIAKFTVISSIVGAFLNAIPSKADTNEPVTVRLVKGKPKEVIEEVKEKEFGTVKYKKGVIQLEDYEEVAILEVPSYRAYLSPSKKFLEEANRTSPLIWINPNASAIFFEDEVSGLIGELTQILNAPVVDEVLQGEKLREAAKKISVFLTGSLSILQIIKNVIKEVYEKAVKSGDKELYLVVERPVKLKNKKVTKEYYAIDLSYFLKFIEDAAVLPVYADKIAQVYSTKAGSEDAQNITPDVAKKDLAVFVTSVFSSRYKYIGGSKSPVSDILKYEEAEKTWEDFIEKNVIDAVQGRIYEYARLIFRSNAYIELGSITASVIVRDAVKRILSIGTRQTRGERTDYYLIANNNVPVLTSNPMLGTAKGLNLIAKDTNILFKPKTGESITLLRSLNLANAYLQYIMLNDENIGLESMKVPVYGSGSWETGLEIAAYGISAIFSDLVRDAERLENSPLAQKLTFLSPSKGAVKLAKKPLDDITKLLDDKGHKVYYAKATLHEIYPKLRENILSSYDDIAEEYIEEGRNKIARYFEVSNYSAESSLAHSIRTTLFAMLALASVRFASESNEDNGLPNLFNELWQNVTAFRNISIGLEKALRELVEAYVKPVYGEEKAKEKIKTASVDTVSLRGNLFTLGAWLPTKDRAGELLKSDRQAETIASYYIVLPTFLAVIDSLIKLIHRTTNKAIFATSVQRLEFYIKIMSYAIKMAEYIVKNREVLKNHYLESLKRTTSKSAARFDRAADTFKAFLDYIKETPIIVGTKKIPLYAGDGTGLIEKLEKFLVDVLKKIVRKTPDERKNVEEVRESIANFIKYELGLQPEHLASIAALKMVSQAMAFDASAVEKTLDSNRSYAKLSNPARLDYYFLVAFGSNESQTNQRKYIIGGATNLLSALFLNKITFSTFYSIIASAYKVLIDAEKGISEKEEEAFKVQFANELAKALGFKNAEIAKNIVHNASVLAKAISSENSNFRRFVAPDRQLIDAGIMIEKKNRLIAKAGKDEHLAPVVVKVLNTVAGLFREYSFTFIEKATDLILHNIDKRTREVLNTLFIEFEQYLSSKGITLDSKITAAEFAKLMSDYKLSHKFKNALDRFIQELSGNPDPALLFSYNFLKYVFEELSQKVQEVIESWRSKGSLPTGIFANQQTGLNFEHKVEKFLNDFKAIIGMEYAVIADRIRAALPEEIKVNMAASTYATAKILLNEMDSMLEALLPKEAVDSFKGVKETLVKLITVATAGSGAGVIFAKEGETPVDALRELFESIEDKLKLYNFSEVLIHLYLATQLYMFNFPEEKLNDFNGIFNQLMSGKVTINTAKNGISITNNIGIPVIYNLVATGRIVNYIVYPKIFGYAVKELRTGEEMSIEATQMSLKELASLVANYSEEGFTKSLASAGFMIYSNISER